MDVTGKRHPFFSAMAVGCAVIAASPCWAAATVEPGSGTLTINRGQGFKPAKSAAEVKVGDSIMVGPGGAATVVYDDGCKVDIRPGAVTTIAPLSPCASGSNAQEPPWLCHPDQTHDCGLTAGSIAFWAAWLGMVGFISYEISQAHGQITVTAKPASP
jgi:hypothetical protein